MTETGYQKVTGFFREHPGRIRALHIINRISEIIIVLSYVGLLSVLLAEKSPQLVRSILVPLDSFIAVSAFRLLADRRRPYEAFGIPPVLPKTKKGRSFPSRHTFSAYVIAMTVLWALPQPVPGALLFVVATVVGAVRILSGVHYPSDVAAGAAIGILSGWVGYWLWP